MYEDIKRVVLDSGLWNGAQRQTHGFVLSPDVYEITEEQKSELEELGRALHECLSGLGRIAAVACNPSLAHTRTWQGLGSILRTGIPLHYHEMQIHKPGQVPAVFKVDLMKTIDGRYMIAEIDGHNKHGLGYSVLCARMRDVVAPGARKFDGVVQAIAHEMYRREKGRLVLLYGEQERFYLPEFSILANALASLGIQLMVKNEADVNLQQLIEWGLSESAHSYLPILFVDFPFFFRNPALNEDLSKMYLEGKIDFLYPPKPFLGSKALMAILRNDRHNSELEAILHAFVPADSIACLRRYIPETHLVSKRKDSFSFFERLCGQKRYVLKETVSSGMHGIFFSDDKGFEKALKRACTWRNKFILQEETTNAPHEFSFYTDEGTTEKATWFLRVIVLYASRSIADIDVTARQDKKVHGAKDCLQLGTVIVG